jgi:hypothetical protein
MKDQKQIECNQKDREQDRKKESREEREIKRKGRQREREKELNCEVEFMFLFINAAIQGGPASGNTQYAERRRYYIAARVPTCK